MLNSPMVHHLPVVVGLWPAAYNCADDPTRDVPLKDADLDKPDCLADVERRSVNKLDALLGSGSPSAAGV